VRLFVLFGIDKRTKLLWEAKFLEHHSVGRRHVRLNWYHFVSHSLNHQVICLCRWQSEEKMRCWRNQSIHKWVSRKRTWKFPDW
jgi:heme-degrading monooxygenase HmoA